MSPSQFSSTVAVHSSQIRRTGCIIVIAVVVRTSSPRVLLAPHSIRTAQQGRTGCASAIAVIVDVESRRIRCILVDVPIAVVVSVVGALRPQALCRRIITVAVVRHRPGWACRRRWPQSRGRGKPRRCRDKRAVRRPHPPRRCCRRSRRLRCCSIRRHRGTGHCRCRPVVAVGHVVNRSEAGQLKNLQVAVAVAIGSSYQRVVHCIVFVAQAMQSSS